MVKRRKPGRPPLSAAEKARRAEERWAAPKRRGRPVGYKVTAKRPGRQPTNPYPELMADLGNRVAKLEAAQGNQKIDMGPFYTAKIAPLEKLCGELSRWMQAATPILQSLEGQVKHLTTQFNEYFGHAEANGLAEAPIETEVPSEAANG